MLGAFLLANLSLCQSFNVNLSPSHQKKLEKTTDFKKKLKKYKGYRVKDSIKRAKQRVKTYSRKLDSLESSAGLDLDIKKKLSDAKSLMNLDTTDVSFAALKSMAASKPEYDEANELLEELESQYGFYLHLQDSLLLSNMKLDSILSLDDSVAIAYLNSHKDYALEELIGQEAAGFIGSNKPPAIGSFTPKKSEFLSKKDELESFKNTDVKKIAEKRLKRLTSGQLEKLDITTKQMKLMKLKYSSIGNSNDLKTAVKQKSLKGTPLGQRTYLGGNFNLNGTTPIVLDISPQIGCYLNKKWITGIGGVYRSNFGASENINSTFPENAFGYNLFMQYSLVKDLFLYSEYNRLKQGQLFSDNNGSIQWNSTTLIGLGMDISLRSIVNGKLMILYDTNQNSNKRLFSVPIIIKMGFNMNALGRVKLFNK